MLGRASECEKVLMMLPDTVHIKLHSPYHPCYMPTLSLSVCIGREIAFVIGKVIPALVAMEPSGLGNERVFCKSRRILRAAPPATSYWLGSLDNLADAPPMPADGERMDMSV